MLGRLGRTSDLENALELARAVADPKGAAAAMAGTALGMITAGAVDRAVSIARELLAVEGDLADPAAACTSAAEVAAAAGGSDLVAEVVARAEVLDTPAVFATVAALLYQRGDQLSASRLLERAAARAREQSDEGDRALGFAQIAQALAPVRGEDARAAASAALSAVQGMKSLDLYGLYKLGEVIAALDAVGDVEGLERLWQARFESDVHRNYIYRELAGSMRGVGTASERSLLSTRHRMIRAPLTLRLCRRSRMGLAAAGRSNEALAAAELLPASQEQARVLAAIAQQLYDAGAEARAVEIAEQAMLASEHVEDHDLHAAALGSIASALAATGAADRAVTTSRAAWRMLSAFAPESRGSLSVESVATALAKVGLVDESLAVASDYRSEPFDASIIKRLGLVLAGRGDNDAALQLARVLQRRASGSYEEPELRAASAEILAAAGEGDAARAELAAALEALQSTAATAESRPFARIADAYARLGDLEAAAAAVAAAERGSMRSIAANLQKPTMTSRSVNLSSGTSPVRRPALPPRSPERAALQTHAPLRPRLSMLTWMASDWVWRQQGTNLLRGDTV